MWAMSGRRKSRLTVALAEVLQLDFVRLLNMPTPHALRVFAAIFLATECATQAVVLHQGAVLETAKSAHWLKAVWVLLNDLAVENKVASVEEFRRTGC